MQPRTHTAEFLQQQPNLSLNPRERDNVMETRGDRDVQINSDISGPGSDHSLARSAVTVRDMTWNLQTRARQAFRWYINEKGQPSVQEPLNMSDSPLMIEHVDESIASSLCANVDDDDDYRYEMSDELSQRMLAPKLPISSWLLGMGCAPGDPKFLTNDERLIDAPTSPEPVLSHGILDRMRPHHRLVSNSGFSVSDLGTARPDPPNTVSVPSLTASHTSQTDDNSADEILSLFDTSLYEAEPSHEALAPPDGPLPESTGMHPPGIDMDRHCQAVHDESIAVAPEDTYASDDSDSDISESLWWSDYSEPDPVLNPEHHILLKCLRPIVDDLVSGFLCSFVQAQNGSASSSSASTGAASSGPPSTAPSTTTADPISKPVASKKRSAGREDDEDDDDRMPRARKKVGSRVAATPRPLLACPFAKRDPVKWAKCFGYDTFDKISRVKMHLSRVHGPPIYCPSCWEVFANEKGRNDHNRSRDCEIRAEVHFDCVSEDQKQALKRRVDAKLSEEEQWFSIFKVLFPSDPLPSSAYLDPTLSEQFNAFREFEAVNGPRIVLARLDEVGFSLNVDEWQALREVAVREALLDIMDEWGRRQQALPNSERSITAPERPSGDLRNISPAATVAELAPTPAPELADENGGFGLQLNEAKFPQSWTQNGWCMEAAMDGDDATFQNQRWESTVNFPA